MFHDCYDHYYVNCDRLDDNHTNKHDNNNDDGINRTYEHK